MPTELVNLELEEVSLVDMGDDPLAKVAIFKRNPEGETMEEDTQMEVEKAPKEDKKVVLEVETEDDDMEDEMEYEMEGKKPTRKSWKAEAQSLEEVNKMLLEEIETLKTALATKEVEKKADEMIDFDGEMIAKSAIPAPVLKKLEEVEKARQAEEIRKKAREVLPNFKGTEDQRGKLLKSIEGVDEYDAILEALLAADALFASAFAEVGKADASGDFGSAEDKLEGMAKAYAAENGTTFEKGYAAVIKTAEGKALFKEINKK